MSAIKALHHDALEMRRAVDDGGWQVITGAHFTLTAEDVTDGRNRLGMDVRHVPLDEPLCSGCDNAIDAGICADCEVIHADLVPLTTCAADPLRRVA